METAGDGGEDGGDNDGEGDDDGDDDGDGDGDDDEDTAAGGHNREKSATGQRKRQNSRKDRLMGRRAGRTHSGVADDEQEPGFTPKRAKNAVRVAKVIIPAAAPALVPLALRAVGAAREAYDRYQARRMGIAVEALPEFRGHGGALLARVAGAAEGLSSLAKSPTATEDDAAFVASSRDTLEQLAASVRAAERMPAARRKAAHRAVAAELDTIENGLLHRLGI